MWLDVIVTHPHSSSDHLLLSLNSHFISIAQAWQYPHRWSVNYWKDGQGRCLFRPQKQCSWPLEQRLEGWAQDAGGHAIFTQRPPRCMARSMAARAQRVSKAQSLGHFGLSPKFPFQELDSRLLIQSWFPNQHFSFCRVLPKDHSSAWDLDLKDFCLQFLLLMTWISTCLFQAPWASYWSRELESLLSIFRAQSWCWLLLSSHRGPPSDTYCALVGLPSAFIVWSDLESSEASVEEISTNTLVLGRKASGLQRSHETEQSGTQGQPSNRLFLIHYL